MISPQYHDGTHHHTLHGRSQHDHSSDLLAPTHKTGIPNELIQLHQWLGYRAIPKPNGKINKPPIDANTGGPGSSTNAATWGPFLAASRRSPSGAALVLTPDDPYFALDLDECVNAETEEISPEAKTIVDRFPIYWEISYSGTGLRGIGRGILPKSGCKKGNIEVYDQGRYVVMTGRTLPGHETIRTCQRELIAWHNEVWPVETERPTRPQPTWSGPGMTNEQLLETAFRARNEDKIRRLYEGDTSGYQPSQSDPGFSNEADLALVSFLCGYTQNDDQVADLWRSGGLYRKKLDRNDYVERTIQQARKNQSWTYDPNHGTTPKLTAVPRTPPSADAGPDTRTIAELLAIIAERDATIAEKDAHIVRLQDRVQIAEARVKQFTTERSHVFGILRNSDLGAVRQTGFAIALDFSARLANGEEPTALGLKAPAKRYAEITGLSENVVAGHMRQLSGNPDSDDPKRKGLGLLTKHVIKEETEREIAGEIIDSETGEIQTTHETVTGKRDANYIEVPDGNVLALIDRLATYQRPDDTGKHGGKRTPRPKCANHPDAGTCTVRNEHIECAHPECHAILETREPTSTYFPPEPDDAPDEESSGTKMMPEPEPESAFIVSDSIMTPEPSWMWESPPDDPGPPPDWQDEHRRVYGQVYRGEEVS